MGTGNSGVVAPSRETSGEAPSITEMQRARKLSELSRRTRRVHLSIPSQSVRPSPFHWRVGIRDFTFEACSALRPVGLLNRPGRLCHEAPVRPVTQPNRSSATRPIDYYLAGFCLHWLSVPLRGTQWNPRLFSARPVMRFNPVLVRWNRG